MAGWHRAWRTSSVPTKPLEPPITSFMMFVIQKREEGQTAKRYETVYVWYAASVVRGQDSQIQQRRTENCYAWCSEYQAAR